jgi:hypothetical protein
MEGQDAPPPRDANKSACVRVDMRKFWRFLGAHVLNFGAVVCSIVPQKALIIHVIMDHLSAFYITYYIPVIQ